VNLTCEGLKPDEGITSKTDANGAFNLSTAGGRLPDTCTIKVTPVGATAPVVTTTVGAVKTPADNPPTRVRQVEVVVPEK